MPRKTTIESINKQREELAKKEALLLASENPQFSELKDILDDLRKRRNDPSNRPETFSQRIEEKQRWIDRYNAQKACAEAEGDSLDVEIDYFESCLADAAEIIAGGEEVDMDDIHANRPEAPEEVQKLREEAEEAIATHKAYLEAKKQPKRKKNENTAEAEA